MRHLPIEMITVYHNKVKGTDLLAVAVPTGGLVGFPLPKGHTADVTLHTCLVGETVALVVESDGIPATLIMPSLEQGGQYTTHPVLGDDASVEGVTVDGAPHVLMTLIVRDTFIAHMDGTVARPDDTDMEIEEALTAPPMKFLVMVPAMNAELPGGTVVSANRSRRRSPAE